MWLEVNDDNFQTVINRLEHKGLTEEDAITKLTFMRRLRRKRAKANKDAIDIFEDNVLDSAMIRGAQFIAKVMIAKKTRKAEARQRKLKLATGTAVLNKYMETQK